MAYYALYDNQLGGFKAGMVGTTPEEVKEMGAARAYDLSQSDEEPCPEDLSHQDILDQYGYDVRVVSKELYHRIQTSSDVGLLTTVSLMEG